MLSWRSKTYDVMLPALSVRGPALRQSLRVVVAAYICFSIHVACVSGSHINLYGEMLGFNELHFNLLSAIPFLATFAQLLASMLIERSGLKKHQYVECMALARLLWIAIAAVPFFATLPSGAAVWAVLFITAASSVLSAVAVPAWWTWMADLIPRRIRGRYMATREGLGQTVRILAYVVVGVALDLAITSRADSEGKSPALAAHEPTLLAAICIIFAAGAIFGAADALLFRRIREVLPPARARFRVAPVASQEQQSVRPGGFHLGIAQGLGTTLLSPLKDKVFRHFTGYWAVQNFAVVFCGMYLWRNAMNYIGLSNLGANLVFMVSGTLTGIVSARPLGRMVDRFGRRPLMIVCGWGTVLTVIQWVFVSPGTPDLGVSWLVNHAAGVAGGWFGRPGLTPLGPGAPVGAFMISMVCGGIGGVAWTGLALAQNSFMLGFSDSQGGSRYIAAFTVLSSLAGFLGGIIGGLVTNSLTFLQDNPLQLGPLTWNHWQISVVVSVLARIAAMGWLVGMPEPSAVPTREVVRYMARGAYCKTIGRLLP